MMLRTLYILLIDMHPSVFRRRFGDEMLDIFDSACGFCASSLLFGDGLLSLIRQWTLRAEFRRPLLAAIAPNTASNVPLFRLIDPYKPRPAALLNGAILAIATILVMAAAIRYGGKAQRFLVGVHYPSPHLLPVARASVTGTDLNTTIKFGPAPEDPWRAIASVYFKFIRVLAVLDADQDLVISPWEIFTAPAALRRLDTNHDGNLSPEECGFFIGTNKMPPDVVQRARLVFMRENPVLAAIDTDHDGAISAAEIANSPAALKKLDRNGDGSLTPDELIPDQQAAQAAIIMIRLDTNGDGIISRAEREAEGGDQALRELLQSADRNHDGVVTQQELRRELGLRAELIRNLKAARKAAGVR